MRTKRIINLVSEKRVLMGYLEYRKAYFVVKCSQIPGTTDWILCDFSNKANEIERVSKHVYVYLSL